ncbi:DUF4113 domain-containing protein [Enterobacter hormaechei]|nr:DUF4113 domain-containing protein [Enterobacter hormaechei]MBY0744741.1 DUF4113 domain-containing protein [Enterobacter sp. M607]MBU8930850.1 DUF4113 domain-containing protein [Enterobacter hormaechei]MBU8938070.1 DUF4113 domain-containing protein [Enterobacter hormaechei]MBU8947528.1 DUF4113 domain-containing protein [Enterobacter hormaechei]
MRSVYDAYRSTLSGKVQLRRQMFSRRYTTRLSDLLLR